MNKVCARAPFYLSVSVLFMSFLVLASVWIIADKVDKQSVNTEKNSLEARVAASLANNQSQQNGQDIARINGTLVDFIDNVNFVFNQTLTDLDRIISNINKTHYEIKHNANKSLYNQEKYFQPYFNESFQKLFQALNITDTGSNYSITGPIR